MTNQLENQPNETIDPQLDWVLLRKLAQPDVLSEAGIDLSQMGKTREDTEWLLTEQAKKGRMPTAPVKHRSEVTSRYLVLKVGPGDFTDYDDTHGNQVFLRKPMQSRVGDVVLVRDVAVREIWLGHDCLYMAQDFALVARVGQSKDRMGNTLEELGVMNNYIFSAPAKYVAMSRGGLALPQDVDYTGNQRFGSERYEALGVGEGAWCLHHRRGEPPSFKRRPLPVQNGDVFCAHGVGFGVAFRGVIMTCLTADQVAAVFRSAPAEVLQ